jgi:tRNA (cmo5U34)-methyltransferase
MSNAPATFDAAASRYDEARRRLIPPFDSFYGTAVAAVRIGGDSPRRILDLGAGTGLLSRKLREAFPAAELTLLDGAPRMLDEARRALGTEAASYVVADLDDPIPAGPWDAVVSALAIHHLGDEAKRRLFDRVHAELRPGGVFVDAEQVVGPTDRFTGLYASWHEASARTAGSDEAEWSGAVARMSHDRCASVEDQLAWLREAGFADVDCVFREYCFAVLVAVR